MTAKRFYYIMLGVCALLIISVGAGVYFGDKLLAQQAQQIAKARADDELVDQKKRIKKDLEKKIATLGSVKSLAETFLPDNKNQDALIAEFNQIAKENGITVDNISFDTSGTTGPGALSQTQALKDIRGVAVLPFSIQAKPVSFTQLITFLKAIENNRRKMQITNISIAPKTDPKEADYGKLSLTEFKLEVYIKSNGTTSATPTTSQTAPATSR